MRFVLLVAGATAVGGLSGVGIQKMFPQSKDMFAAVTALGGNVADIKLGEINPVKAYEEVKRQITSGQPAVSFPTAGSTPTYNFKPVDIGNLNPPLTIDTKQFQRAWASDMNRRVQQDVQRARDFQAYGRNPMGWHGIPPH
jgi:hypothetical protein